MIAGVSHAEFVLELVCNYTDRGQYSGLLVAAVLDQGHIGPRTKGKPPPGTIWDGLTELNNPLPRWWLHLFNITIVFSHGLPGPVIRGWEMFQGVLGWTQLTQYDAELVAAEATEQESVFGRFQRDGSRGI